MIANKDVKNVCAPCGITANYLTALRKFGRPPYKPSFDVSTFHEDTCDVCGYRRPCTEPRDFFHPDFELVFNLIKWDHDCVICPVGVSCSHSHCGTCINRNKKS